MKKHGKFSPTHQGSQACLWSRNFGKCGGLLSAWLAPCLGCVGTQSRVNTEKAVAGRDWGLRVPGSGRKFLPKTRDDDKSQDSELSGPEPEKVNTDLHKYV